MLKFRLIIPLILLAVICLGQNEVDDSFYYNNVIAKEEILKLKSSAIFIRVRNYSRTLSQLRSQSYEKTAQSLEDRRAKELATLTQAAKQIDFCKVYYFMDNEYDQILAGDYSKLYELSGKKAVYNDTNFFILNPYDQTMNTLNSSLRGFFMLDKYGKVIPKPFPFGVFNNLFKPDSEERLDKLNYDLTQFYNVQVAFDAYLEKNKPSLHALNKQHIATAKEKKEYAQAYKAFKRTFIVPKRIKFKSKLNHNLATEKQ